MNLKSILSVLSKIWKFLNVIFKTNKKSNHGKTKDLMRQSRILNKEIVIKITFNPFEILVNKKVTFDQVNNTEVLDSGFTLKLSK